MSANGIGIRTLTQTVLNRQMAHTKLNVSFALARNSSERMCQYWKPTRALTHPHAYGRVYARSHVAPIPTQNISGL